MKCEHCNHDIESDSVFCEYCGNKIRSKSKRLQNKRLILSIAGLLIVIVVVCAIVLPGGDKVSYTTGTTLSCVSDNRAFDKEFVLKSYFVFKSNNEVMWLVGQNREEALDLMPIGDGLYNPSSNEITFSTRYFSYSKLELYSVLDIVFKINKDDNTITMQTRPDITDESLHSDILCFQRNTPLPLKEESFRIKISDNLVGTHWVCEQWNVDAYFSPNEVMIIGNTGDKTLWPYIYSSSLGYISVHCDDDMGFGMVAKYAAGDEELYFQPKNLFMNLSDMDSTALVFKKVI